jgi:uncharacterized protein (DUF2336 family)
MATTLTQADVEKLLAEPSAQVRAEVASKLAKEIDSPSLTESELQLAQDIVRVMAKDIEVSVRQSLSQSLRSAARLPHDIAVRLANDIESVAMPILMHSQVLTDDDLTAIVKSGAGSKQEAIASRPNVSEKLSDILVSTSGEKAVAKLMANPSAKIHETSFSKAVDRFPQSDAVKENIVRRPALPITVAERLVTVVSDKLKDYLVSHHELSPNIAADIVMQNRERTIIGLSESSNAQELEKMVAQMHASGRLTPSLLLRSLCMGDVAFFEMSMAVMAKVPLLNARILIHDGGKLGLKSIYSKTGLPLQLLSAMRVAVDVINETEMDGGTHDLERYRARIIERVLTQFEDMNTEDIDYLLDKLEDVLHVAA